MSIVASVYGRLSADPVERQTKTGKPMTTASLAVDAAGKDAAPETLWISVLGFGAASDALLRASKGHCIAVMGRLTRGYYTTAAGETREQWTLIADNALVPASARPGGQRRRDGQSQGPGQPARTGAGPARLDPY